MVAVEIVGGFVFAGELGDRLATGYASLAGALAENARHHLLLVLAKAQGILLGLGHRTLIILQLLILL